MAYEYDDIWGSQYPFEGVSSPVTWDSPPEGVNLMDIMQRQAADSTIGPPLPVSNPGWDAVLRAPDTEDYPKTETLRAPEPGERGFNMVDWLNTANARRAQEQAMPATIGPPLRQYPEMNARFLEMLFPALKYETTPEDWVNTMTQFLPTGGAGVGGMVKWGNRTIPNMYLFRGMRDTSNEIRFLDQFMDRAAKGQVQRSIEQSTSPMTTRDFRRATPQGVVYHGDASEWPAMGIGDIYTDFTDTGPLFTPRIPRETAEKTYNRLFYLRDEPTISNKIDMMKDAGVVPVGSDDFRAAAFAGFDPRGDLFRNDKEWKKHFYVRYYSEDPVAWERQEGLRPSDYLSLPKEEKLRLAEAAGYEAPQDAKYMVKLWDDQMTRVKLQDDALQNVGFYDPKLEKAMRDLKIKGNDPFSHIQGPFSLIGQERQDKVWGKYQRAIDKIESLREEDRRMQGREYAGSGMRSLLMDPRYTTPEEYFRARLERFSDPTVGKPSGSYGEIVHRLSPDTVHERVAGVVVDKDNPNKDLLAFADKRQVPIFILPYEAEYKEPTLGRLARMPKRLRDEIRDEYFRTLGTDTGYPWSEAEQLWNEHMNTGGNPYIGKTPLNYDNYPELTKAYETVMGTMGKREPFVRTMMGGLREIPGTSSSVPEHLSTYDGVITALEKDPRLAELYAKNYNQHFWTERTPQDVIDQLKRDADDRSGFASRVSMEKVLHRLVDDPEYQAMALNPFAGAFVEKKMKVGKSPGPTLKDLYSMSEDETLRYIAKFNGKTIEELKRDTSPIQLRNWLSTVMDRHAENLQLLGDENLKTPMVGKNTQAYYYATQRKPPDKIMRRVLTSSEVVPGYKYKYSGRDWAWE